MDATNIYMRELKNVGSTKEESIDLIKRARSGDDSAREVLIKNYLLLVVKIAREYLNMGVPLGDLISEGNVGLLTAIEKYDIARQSPFSSCAKYWIRQSINRNCMHKKPIVRLPENVSELMRTDRWVGVPYREVSIDSPNDEGDTMAADIPDQAHSGPFKREEELILQKRVEKILSFLNKRDAEVMKAFYGIGIDKPMELQEIAEQFNLSTTRVNQIRRSSLQTMKDAAVEIQMEVPKFRSPKTVEIKKVEIVTALYGANEKFVDVTDLVSGMVEKGQRVRINNKLAGDPCYGIPKKLTVTYIIDEDIYTQAFPEGSTLKF
jgi:RNA polymerase primary sigma factor